MTERNPYHPDGLWPTAGSYTRTDDDGLTLLMVQQQRDQATARAEKAEKERDETRADLAEYVQAQALRTQPRPLTPDAITDEMVTRALVKADQWDGVLINRSVVWEVLTAALTEPPARPEGAEELEADINRDGERAPFDLTPDHVTALADHLAAMGYRKEMNR